MASVCLPGLNATEYTVPVPPVRGWPSGRGCTGSATSHSRTVPSEPLASRCSPGLNAIATSPAWLVRTVCGRLQSRMVPSRLPPASVCPSGLNATDATTALLPVSGWPSGRGCAGSATSQSRTVPSELPLASVCPSGLNATATTMLPVRGWPSSRGCAGSATSHSRTVPSRLPLASVCPSGLNATEYTAAVPPVRGWPSGRGCAGSATSHSRIVPSESAAGQRVPIGAERHREDGGAVGQGLAERPGVRGIGHVPQLDRAVSAAAGQRVPVGS